jgi:hypothetical protein
MIGREEAIVSGGRPVYGVTDKAITKTEELPDA